jgi:hypothetical protein
MAQVTEGVFPDAWLPTGKKFLNEQLAQDITHTSPSVVNSGPSGWSSEEETIFRDQGLEPSRVREYERLARTRVRRRGALVAAHEISAEYRTWDGDGQLLRHWSTGSLESPGHTDVP